MPARTVVVGRMSKWDGRRRRLLIPNEFQQMPARAGRRGMDPIGHVVVPYSPWLTFRETLDIATGELHPYSRPSLFATTQSSISGILPARSRPHVAAQSLAQFQSGQRIRDLEDQIIQIGEDIARIPQGCLIGLDGGEELLEDYRRVNRSLAAAQSKERRLTERRTDTSVERQLESATLGTNQDARRYAGRSAWPRPEPWPMLARVAGPIFLGRGSIGRSRAVPLPRRQYPSPLPISPSSDHLTDKRIALPPELINPGDGVGSAIPLVSTVELASLWQGTDELDLPDLDAIAAEHRAIEQERAASSSPRSIRMSRRRRGKQSSALWNERQETGTPVPCLHSS